MMNVGIHHCPRCDLRFATAAETEDHLYRDHDVTFSSTAGVVGLDLDDPPEPRGSITVPVDPTKVGSPAVRVATALAAQASWGLRLVAVTPDGLDELAVGRFLSKELRGITGVPSAVARQLPGADTADAIVHDAADGTTTLLCMDSHAKGPAAELAFGSVSEDVVRRATVPVLVCGPHVQPAEHYTRIIVGLDGSELAERALTGSVALGRALGASLALLEVLPPDVTLPDDVSETAYLSRLRARTGIPTDDYDTIHHQRPARALIEAADAAPGTIIAVATHGRSGFQRLRVGSVAMDVVRHAHGPVLVVPAGG
jgi:nucleotide-binding universal stress UspA family protein